MPHNMIDDEEYLAIKNTQKYKTSPTKGLALTLVSHVIYLSKYKTDFVIKLNHSKVIMIMPHMQLWFSLEELEFQKLIS